MSKLMLVLTLALGTAACVDEEDGTAPQPDPDPSIEDNIPTNGDSPPDDVIPGPGDDTCGGNALKGDGPCLPPD